MLNISKTLAILATLIFLGILVSLGGFEFYSSVFNFQKDEIEIIFGGDMMFDRYIRQISEENGYDFTLSDLRPYLNSVDFVIANLEGPITDEESISMGSKIGGENNYTFTFSPKIIPSLINNNIGILNLGNNHIYNFGGIGVDLTKKYLNEAGLKYFGLEREGLEINNKQVSVYIINYNQFSNIGVEEIIEEITSKSSQYDHIVVYTHWGVEYQKEQPDYIKETARSFVDAGANLVFGSHPHVIGETENYKGDIIYYSLGNLVFDQYWNEDVSTGLLVKVLFDKDGYKILEERKVKLTTNGQTKLIKNDRILGDERD